MLTVLFVFGLSVMQGIGFAFGIATGAGIVLAIASRFKPKK
jgi:hypothetical protein